MLASQLGHYSLILGLILSLGLLYYLFIYLRDGNNILQKNIYSISFLQLFLVVLSFFCLVYSFIISDFSNKTTFPKFFFDKKWAVEVPKIPPPITTASAVVGNVINQTSPEICAEH